jgi:hypothetical protein
MEYQVNFHNCEAKQAGKVDLWICSHTANLISIDVRLKRMAGRVRLMLYGAANSCDKTFREEYDLKIVIDWD